MLVKYFFKVSFVFQLKIRSQKPIIPFKLSSQAKPPDFLICHVL